MVDKRVPGIGRLLVKKINEERKTSSGIIFADTFEPTTQMVQVVAIGEVKGTYTVGDRVCIMRSMGTNIDNDELVIFEGDILFSVSCDELA